MKKYLIFDFEGNGLYNEITKFHCMSYYLLIGDKYTYGETTNLQECISILNSVDVLVGHFIGGFDIPALEKLSGEKVNTRYIDTLGLSWYLKTTRPKHGLESYGKEFGIPKVKIDDWENLTIEEYLARCKRDVQINLYLWIQQKKMLYTLYGEHFWDIVNYLNTNIEIVFEQSQNPFTLNLKLVRDTLNEVKCLIYEKVENLSNAMPKELGKLTKSIPKILTKKDGTMSNHGYKWFEFLKENELPLDTLEIRDEPNPVSNNQLKAWLFSLGWIPETYEENVKGVEIPKVSLPFGKGLCPSVLSLIEKYPVVENLKSLYMLKHRAGILKNFLQNEDNGTLVSGISALTRTLRWKHRSPIVNLPKPSTPYGKEIRGSLTVPEGYMMIGTDVSGLESMCADIWINFFDPKYVKEKRQPGFCPHLDIAVLGNLMSEEDSDFYKAYKKLSHEEKQVTSEKDSHKFHELDNIRFTAKTTNFSSTYNAGPSTIAKTAGITLQEGKLLHKTFWDRNWAIKKVAESFNVVLIEGEKWLFNPLSKFWYPLKVEKDRFSLGNQGLGMYVFIQWCIEARKLGVKMSLGYHDEFAFIFPKEDLEKVRDIPHIAMDRVNKRLNFSLDFTVSVDIGMNYSECH